MLNKYNQTIKLIMYNTSDMELKWSKLLESLAEQSDLTTKGGSEMQEDSTL